jgi:16S rRNA (cytidine1402-2'-O)-methyltransferase
VSGLPTGRFTFEGFLATNKKNRRAHLDSLREEQRTMIFYEAPHKLLGTLGDLTEAFGTERRVALCRELTKLHEEVLRTTLVEALEHYRSNAPRGEFVLVVEGAPEQEEAPALTLEEAVERVRSLHQGGVSMKDAARQVAGETGFQKKELYRLAVQE